MFEKRSTLPASSNSPDMVRMRLSRTNASIEFLSAFAPISLDFRSPFIESITSVATSDSRSAISSSNKTSSMSFSFSSFSPKLFETFENAPVSFSNILPFLSRADASPTGEACSFPAFPALGVPRFPVFWQRRPGWQPVSP